jgi:hypothetical protein
MRITPKAAPTDPRSEPLPLRIDPSGLARHVQAARTPEEAWAQLNLPGGRAELDPGVVEALATVATDLCTIGDAIGKGLVAFGARDPEEPIPAAWVDRMVELHAALLEGYWRLDDLAYAGVKEGGWTITTREPLDDDPAGRVAQRARWVAEENKPREPALWFDRALRRLDDLVAGYEREASAADPAEVLDAVKDAVKDAGRALVAEATRRRFARWHETRRET